MLYSRKRFPGIWRWLIPIALLLLAAVWMSGCGTSLKTVSSAKSNVDSSGNGGVETTAIEATRSDAGIEQSGKERSSAHNGGESKSLTGSEQGTDTAVSAATNRKNVEPFVEASRSSGGSGNEADSILGVRYGKHGGFERMVVNLGVGNRSAGKVPEWSLLSPEGDGLLRVTFPSVSMTRVSDGPFESSMLKDYYVVRAPESGMFVDVFVRSGFIYRVIELNNPARLAIDFKATNASLRFPLPAEGGNTVLTEPRRGASMDGPVLVRGYSRNPEAHNTIILRSSSGKILFQRSVSSNDWTSTWGYFETTLDPPPFSGKAALQVGTSSARDGSFSGASIPVRGG